MEGSYVPGTRPLGFISMKGFCLITSKLKDSSSYGSSKSSMNQTTFQGLGPGAVKKLGIWSVDKFFADTAHE
jgi:hypothetical protein